MPGLIRTVRAYGGTTVIEADPRLDEYEDVLLVPFGIETAGPGLYDRARRMITASGTFRGVPALAPVHGGFVSDLDPDLVDAMVDRPGLVFGGYLDSHFGHFLLSSLSRFWWIRFAADPAAKIVVLNQGSLAALFDRPFIRDTLGVLGLGIDDFLTFDQPVRIRQIAVPDASFMENNCAHRVFARMCNRIGAILAPDDTIVPIDRPLYLSKAKVQSGVSTVVNEDEFCEHLERRGVEIISPETLPFPAQIRMFKERKIIAGPISSALHTGIFAATNRLLVLNHGEEVWSNQLLLDGVNGNTSLYMNPREHLARVGSSAGFGNLFRLHDPGRIAAEFCRALDAFMTAGDTTTTVGEDRGAPPLPRRVNLARGKPAVQSSVCYYSFGRTPEDDAAGAVSGLLTGYYQAHTALEWQPWWAVDLQRCCLVDEVRIYNRLDEAACRNARLSLMASNDGKSWTTLMTREQPTPFGGLDGRPLIWRVDEPVRARYLRIQLPGQESLQLDQVQVFGRVPQNAGPAQPH